MLHYCACTSNLMQPSHPSVFILLCAGFLGCFSGTVDGVDGFMMGPNSEKIPPVGAETVLAKQPFTPGECNLLCGDHRYFAMINGGECACSEAVVDEAFIKKLKSHSSNDCGKRLGTNTKKAIYLKGPVPLPTSNLNINAAVLAGAQQVSCKEHGQYCDSWSDDSRYVRTHICLDAASQLALHQVLGIQWYAIQR